MGDSTCFMQPFSYVSGIPNDAHEENPIHALGQSVSFGRFMSESLSWEKWSTFSSHNKYVEEAERYARPGSVAQKKAFFEAHYKSIAAKKAAALLEKTNTATKHDQDTEIQDDVDQEQVVIANSDAKVENFEAENQIPVEDSVKVESLEQNFGHNCTKIRDFMQKEMEKPLLQDVINNQDEDNAIYKKKQAQFASKSSTQGREFKVPSSPSRLLAKIHPKKETKATPVIKKSSMDTMDRRKSTPKSSQKSMNFTPAKEFNKFASSFMSRVSSTPLRTPKKPPSSTPWSENKSARTPLDAPVSGTKSVRKKWGLFPTENKSRSSNIFSPFTLRTEERAARRKQKLEEKFNSSQTEKLQQQATLKEKAETEFRKLRQSFCFKARPLPEFYKERKTTIDQIKQITVTQQPETPLPEKQTTTPCKSAMKSANHGKMSSIKSIGSKLMLEKKGQNSVRSFMSRAATMVAHENTSPNIQHSQTFSS